MERMTRSSDGRTAYLIHEVWEEYSHPRTKGLLATPWPLVTVVAAYLSFVLWIGPRIMATRKPLDVTRIMRIYNFVNIFCNGMLCLLSVYFTRWTYECWFCQESSAPSQLVIMGSSWVLVFFLLLTLSLYLSPCDEKRGKRTWRSRCWIWQTRSSLSCARRRIK